MKANIYLSKLKYLAFIIPISLCLPSTVMAGEKQSGVEHIVFCWLNNPGNKEETEKFIELSKELKEIPEVNDIKTGTTISSDRMFVDDTFDVGLVISFNNQQDMESYLVNETHVNLVKTSLGPMCNRLLVYDVAY